MLSQIHSRLIEDQTGESGVQHSRKIKVRWPWGRNTRPCSKGLHWYGRASKSLSQYTRLLTYLLSRTQALLSYILGQFYYYIRIFCDYLSCFRGKLHWSTTELGKQCVTVRCYKKAEQPNDVGIQQGTYWGAMHVYPDGQVGYNDAASWRLAMRNKRKVE